MRTIRDLGSPVPARVARPAAQAWGAPSLSEANAAARAMYGEDAPQLSPATSPLLRSLFVAALPTLDNGTVPPKLFATHRNSVDLTPVIGDKAIFAKICEGLRTAKGSASLQVYEWHAESKFGQQILRALNQRARGPQRPGLEGPFVFRALMNQKNPLLSAYEHQPLRPMTDLQEQLKIWKFDPKRVVVEVAAHKSLGRASFHTKSGRFGDWGIIQGQNVEEVGRYDVAYVLRGEVLDSIDADTAEAWNEVAAPSARRPRLAAPAKPVAADLPILTTTRNETPREGGLDSPQNTVLISALRQMGKGDVVKLITPNISDLTIRSEILEALARGVKLQVVLPKDFNDNKNKLPGAGGGNQEHIDWIVAQLKARNVSLSGFDLRWYSEDGKKPHSGQAGGCHAKGMWIFSPKGCLSFVGSSNMDKQSVRYSRELNLVVDSRRVAEAWSKAVFEPVFARSIPAFGQTKAPTAA